MKIAFQTPILDVRGTCVSLYDYAYYNETLLKNESIIIAPISCVETSDQISITRFSKQFRVFFYTSAEHMESIIDDCDVLYTIKYGTNDGLVSKNIKTVVHCVFDMTDPHGDVYAAVSSTLAKKFGKELFVPHMIGLSPSTTGENMRVELGIPHNAVVFGRHGGMDTFDLQIARSAIVSIVQNCPNIYFIFINTPVFFVHPRIIHLGKIVDHTEKNRFICTCDAHLECGSLGHTFGLAMGEFSVNNKPIIAYNGWTWNTAHFDILGCNGIYFKTEEEFYDILSTFNPKNYRDKDNNCYRDYSPEAVMNKFKEVFLS